MGGRCLSWGERWSRRRRGGAAVGDGGGHAACVGETRGDGGKTLLQFVTDCAPLSLLDGGGEVRISTRPCGKVVLILLQNMENVNRSTPIYGVIH